MPFIFPPQTQNSFTEWRPSGLERKEKMKTNIPFLQFLSEFQFKILAGNEWITICSTGPWGIWKQAFLCNHLIQQKVLFSSTNLFGFALGDGMNRKARVEHEVWRHTHFQTSPSWNWTSASELVPSHRIKYHYSNCKNTSFPVLIASKACYYPVQSMKVLESFQHSTRTSWDLGDDLSYFLVQFQE